MTLLIIIKGEEGGNAVNAGDGIDGWMHDDNDFDTTLPSRGTRKERKKRID